MNLKTLLFTIQLVASISINSLAQELSLKINLRGVFESTITLKPLTGASDSKLIGERAGIKNGETVIFPITRDLLPGEFLVHFESKGKADGTPSPSDKHLLMSNQSVEIFVNPLFCNYADSTWFQKEEKENTAMGRFNLENSRQKGQLRLLQNFLMGYNDTQSKIYLLGTVEYNKKRDFFNQWVQSQTVLYKELYASHFFQFQYLPMLKFQGNETEKMQSLLDHYFDGVDFKDSLLTRTTNLKEWMNGYVNIYGSMAKTDGERDSLLTLAGFRAIEKAKRGHPKVYGWMVDYFYSGYESFQVGGGMTMLQQYLDDPQCFTAKREQIIKRIESMTRLSKGTLAPDFTLKDSKGELFNLHAFKGAAKYKLLLFWSADCDHCRQLVSQLNQWYLEPFNKAKLDIVAVSMDDTATEVQKWEQEVPSLPGWKHLRTTGGVNSSLATNYALLSTPVMFLIDSKNNIIKAVPDTLDKLITEIGKI